MHRFVFPLLLLMTSSAHATWLHLCPPGHAPAGMPGALVVSPDGTQARLVASDLAALPGCRPAFSLPVPAQLVQALHPLPPQASPADVILLQGMSENGRFLISEATLPAAQPAPVKPVPMPLHVNLLAAMQARVFGAEERARARIENGRLHLECGAGSKPAGVVLAGSWHVPRADVVLQAAYSGNGDFAWQAADAARAAQESALPMASIKAHGLMQTARMKLPAALERGDWQQFVLLCPPGPASLQIDTLMLTARDGKAAPRSAWIWQPQEWQEKPEALLDWAQRHGIGDIFIAVPLQDGTVRDAAALARFVRQAGARGLGVWSVDGDPHMVLPAEQQATVQRARAYAAYNAAVESSAQLRGMQFDIEPYLLPGYEAAAGAWDRRYLELADALHKAAGKMPLEFVVPFWWAGKPELLSALAHSADSLAVMNYRTDAEEIYRFAVPFLDWADAHGKRVRIALEAGPIAPETQRRYVRAGKDSPGELLLLRVEGSPVLVLLGAALAREDTRAQASNDMQTFRLESSKLFDGSATTFHADKDRLLRLLPQLERDFGAWRGFAGIALHELR